MIYDKQTIKERIESWLIERGVRKRKCTICRKSIPTTEAHFAFYTKRWDWTSRTNICLFCIELTLKILKGSSSVKISDRRRERALEELLEAL